MGEKRPRSFYFLAAFFAAYVLFLYWPMFAIYLLSFQVPDGGLTFPMNGTSLVWFGKIFSGGGIVDIGAAFKRSLRLGFVVMILTVVLSVSAGMAFRKSFRGATVLFYTAIASLIMPSIITSLGIALEFRLFDDFMIKHGIEGWTTAMGLFTSGLGAHLTWTLPFGLLIMFAVFNRFDPRYEKYGLAARCGRVRAAEVPVLALEDRGSDARRRIEVEIEAAKREDRAEAIVLGCAGMVDLAAALSTRHGLPVVDGVTAAVVLIESLVRLGLATSKVGGYAEPLPKAVAGASVLFPP